MDDVEGETHDISETGILFETVAQSPPQVDARIGLTLADSTDGQELLSRCAPEVVRVAAAAGIAHNRGMQLIKKMFGRGPGTGPAPGTESAQFHESDINSESGSRNAPRRELVQVVLRDSMRRHGIPSAWIDCRILSVVTRSQRTGMHVQFIVRDGIDRLLTYVPAFQTSFMEEIARFDPRVDDWLFSVSWQFLHFNTKVASLMPDPAVWVGTTAGAPLQAQAPIPSAVAPEPARPAAATPAPTAAPTPASRPARTPAPASTAAPVQAGAAAARNEEVLEDLQALYAIRDAALRQGRPGAPAPAGPAGEKDFESTHPGDEPDAVPPPPKRW